MNRIFVGLLALFLIVGCSAKQNRQQYAIPTLNEVKIAGTGEDFFRRETTSEDKTEAKLLKISVLELNQTTLSLRCQEFTKKTSGRDAGAETWNLKDEFDRRYEYKRAPLVIKLRDYEFEVLEIEQGRIRYMRVM